MRLDARPIASPAPPAPTGGFLLPVCFARAEELEELLSAMDLYRILNRESEWTSAHLAVIKATYNMRSGCACASLPDGISINANGDVEIDMCGNIIINNCGCGCGDTSSAAGTTGATGTTGVGDSVVTFPAADGVPVDCYAQKATDYLLERARDYQTLMIDIAITGFDNLLGPADEAVDLAALAVGLLTGDVDSNSYREFTSNAVNAAFDDAAFRATMRAAWTSLGYTGEISRDQLRTWSSKAPILVQGIPMRSWLSQWLSTSVVPFYNRELARFATECATGNTLANTGTLSDLFAIGADTYTLLLGSLKTVALGVPYEMTIPSGYEAVAWFWSMSNEVSDCPVTPSPTFQLDFGGELRENNGQGFSQTDAYYFMRIDSSSPMLADVQVAFPGVGGPGELGTIQPEPGAFGGAFSLSVTDAGQWCAGYTIDYTVNLLLRATGAGGGA